MDLTSIGIGYLILFLFILNFIIILLIRSEERYWITGVILWIFLFFAAIVFHVSSKQTVNFEEIIYNERTVENENDAIQLEQLKEKTSAENLIFLRLLGFQTIFSCVWQFLGYSTTGKKYYRTSTLSFLFLILIYVIIELQNIL